MRRRFYTGLSASSRKRRRRKRRAAGLPPSWSSSESDDNDVTSGVDSSAVPNAGESTVPLEKVHKA